MALGLVKTYHLGFFSLKGSSLQQHMIVNFVKSFIFYLKSREFQGNMFTDLMSRWQSWWVNNSGLFMFAIGLSATKCLQGLFVVSNFIKYIK